MARARQQEERVQEHFGHGEGGKGRGKGEGGGRWQPVVCFPTLNTPSPLPQVREVNAMDMEVCCTLGMLNEEQAAQVNGGQGLEGVGVGGEGWG